MRRLLSAALLSAAFTGAGHAQDDGTGRDLERVLTFETEHQGTYPRGWGGVPLTTIAVDPVMVHSGRWSARIERTAASAGEFSTLTKVIPIAFAGSRIEWRGFL